MIDVHAHICPANFPGNPSPGQNAAWPCMCNGDLMLGDTLFRKLDARSWDISRRLEDMARDGVAMQVLSPMPELLSHWFTPGDATVLADHMNGAIAEMTAAAPTRFAGLGMAPEANYLRRINEFGLAGVEIGTHIAGVMLGDTRLDPFWAEAEALDLAVFIHPLHPLTQSLKNVPKLFHPLVGFPLDSAMAGASILMGGVLQRFPRLRIGLSHGGGAMPAVLHRLDQAWNVMPAYRATMAERPSEQAEKFFYDSNVYDPRYLTYLTTQFAPGRVFLGTDYPYEIMQTAPHEYLAQLPETVRESVAQGAAMRFLGSKNALF